MTTWPASARPARSRRAARGCARPRRAGGRASPRARPRRPRPARSTSPCRSAPRGRPSASAFTTSAPRSNPPSTSTSTRSPTASTTARQHLDRPRQMDRAGARRGWRRSPPRRPPRRASTASSGCVMPFSTSGRLGLLGEPRELAPGQRGLQLACARCRRGWAASCAAPRSKRAQLALADPVDRAVERDADRPVARGLHAPEELERPRRGRRACSAGRSAARPRPRRPPRARGRRGSRRTRAVPARSAARAHVAAPPASKSPIVPIGASSTGSASAMPRTVVSARQRRDVAPDARAQQQRVERRAVRAQRDLGPGAARDVLPDLRRQRGAGRVGRPPRRWRMSSSPRR